MRLLTILVATAAPGRRPLQRHPVLRAVTIGLAVSLASLASPPVSMLTAQDPPRVAKPSVHRILGVFDAESGAPIDGAEVVDLFVDGVYRTQATGLIGLWAFTSRNDSVAVRVRKIGYIDTAFVVLMTPRDTTPVPVYLRKPVTLPAVVANANPNAGPSVHMREFESRLTDRSLSGRFLTPADLRKMDSKPITNVIHDIAAGKTRGCLGGVKVFVDGIPYPAGDTSTLSHSSVNEFEAVEFYTMASTPLQYGGTMMTSSPPVSGTRGSGAVVGAAGPKASGGGTGMGCGTVLLWRRETVFP